MTAAARSARRDKPKPPDLLNAGLSALRSAHGRHSRLFETLLGIDPSPERKALFKLPTFDDLFDERAARSLERLGVVQALADLRERLDGLDQRLQRLERAQPPRTPAKRSKKNS